MEEPINVNIQLTERLVSAARKLAHKRGFGSVEEFLVSLLRKEVRMEGGETISEEEKEKIKKRLKDLGYLE